MKLNYMVKMKGSFSLINPVTMELKLANVLINLFFFFFSQAAREWGAMGQK